MKTEWNIFVERVQPKTPVRYFSVDAGAYREGVFLDALEITSSNERRIAPIIRIDGEENPRSIEAELLEYNIDGRWQKIDEVMEVKR